MIRINLLKSLPVAGAPARRAGSRILSRREAVIGIVFLAAASGVLFFLASRPRTSAPAGTKPEPPPPQPSESAAGAALPPAPVSSAPAAPPGQGCVVNELSIGRQPGALVVSVRTGAEVKYRSFKLKAPERIVVDLPDCRLALPRDQHTQSVKHPEVQRVRASQFQAGVFRVVVDVTSMPRHEIRSLPDSLEIRVLDGRP